MSERIDPKSIAPAMPEHHERLIAAGVHDLMAYVHANAIAKGWYDTQRSVAEAVAMIHCELSEYLEAMRSEDPGKPDKHCPDFSAAEVELADAIIRILDHAASQGHRVADALIAKHKFNLTRPYKHGKRF